MCVDGCTSRLPSVTMLRSAGLRLGTALLVCAAAGLGGAAAAYAGGGHAPAVPLPTPPPDPVAAADGWLEWGLRGLFHATALLFVAALVLPRMAPGRGYWPVPDGLAHPLAARLRERRHRLVTDLGWLALGTGVAAALADAASGPGPFSTSATAHGLLGDTGAGARTAAVLLLAAAAVTHRRRPRLAAALGVLALAAMAVAAQGAGAPRASALLADMLLLLGGALALGGLGLLLLVWTGPLRRDPTLREAVRRQVLPPFVRVALPAVLVAGAVLAFPPPSGRALPAKAAAAGPCSPCPLAAAAPDELPIAANAGSQLVAAWVRRSPDAVTGTVRVIGITGRPSSLPIRLRGLATATCGQGCLSFRAPSDTRALTVEVTEDDRRYTARLPAVWSADGNARARRLVAEAQAAMRGITSVRQVEEVTSGPGSYARTDYRFRAPDRMAFRTDRGVQSVVDGARQWRRVDAGPWAKSTYGAGLGFRTGRWFRWTPYARTARLLGVRRRGGRRVAELALYEENTPVWLRLSVELATRRVLHERLTARAHYMSARYHAFDRPLRIALPEAPGVR